MGAATPTTTGDPTGLPPPGDARREELKRRLDTLNQEIESISSELQTEGIDPKKFQIDPEVAQHAMDDDLSGFAPQEGYQYAWMYRDPYNKFGNRVFFAAVREGWEPVKQSMAEVKDAHHRLTIGPGGEIFNSDCLLMRIRLDQHYALERQNRTKRRARELGLSAQLVALAESKGVNVHVGIPSHIRSQIEAASQANMEARRVMRASDSHLRNGTLPGLRAPGR